MTWMPQALTLAIGAGFVWWLYGDGWKQHRNDTDARKVTGVAMFGTYVPFAFLAFVIGP